MHGHLTDLALKVSRPVSGCMSVASAWLTPKTTAGASLPKVRRWPVAGAVDERVGLRRPAGALCLRGCQRSMICPSNCVAGFQGNCHFLDEESLGAP